MLVVLTLLSWASVPLFLREFKLVGIIDPFTANGWRYGISAAFWLPYLFYLAKKNQLPRPLLVASIVPVLFNVPGQTCFAWGPTLLEPGFFSFIFRIQIIFVTLGAYVLFPSERALLRSWRYWVGVLLIAAGAVGLFLFRDAPPASAVTERSHHDFILGVAVAIASGVLFAGYGLSVRYYVSKFPPIASFGVICQYSAVLMIIIMFIFGGQSGAAALNMNAWQWFMLTASAFIGIAISHVMYYASLRHLGVSMASGIIQLQPIFTAVGSMFIFGEKLNAAQWACGIVGVLGAMLMLSAGTAAKKRELERQRADELQPEGS